MADYSTDSKGIVRVRDDAGTKVFDRDSGVSVTGWSTQVRAIRTRFKNVTESTGKSDPKRADND